MFPTIVVDNKGTALAYIDSGPPPEGGVYTTIFAVHGIQFASPIFKKVSAISHTKGLRFVAINRRGYRCSTPFPDADISVPTNGTAAEKTDWLRDRGLEIANFIDAFIQREKLSPISGDGKRGGVALLGWSVGAIFTTAAIAHVASLSLSTQERLALHVRAHIIQDPPSIAFGLPFPPQTYSPERDTFIPEKRRTAAFTVWLTSYFQHGDLSTRDTNVLEYAVPATFRVPSIWNMSQDEMAEIIDEAAYLTADTPFVFNCMPQSHSVYMAATFDKSTKAQLPHLKIWLLTGDATVSFCLAALFSIEYDDKVHGGNNISYKVLPGMNHFMHWDEPEKTVESYFNALR